MSKRMYIVVNSKLTKSQRIPQASHAVAEYMHHQSDGQLTDWVENHRTMVCLHTDEDNMSQLVQSGLKNEIFIDEDLDNMFTAVAFEPMTKEEGNKYFSSLSLA